jgi:hypothetical protein
MRNATPRVADTGEKKAGQTYQLTDLTTKSKAAAHACQGARIGFRRAFGALALSALVCCLLNHFRKGQGSWLLPMLGVFC